MSRNKKSFNNVEKVLPGFEVDRVLRPRVNRIDDLNKLSNELKSTPTAIVNFFVDVGLEVLERTMPILKNEIEKEVKKKVNDFLK